MSVFTGGKKWGRAAKQLRVEAGQAQEDLEDLNFGRELLSNIRQQRFAAAQLRMLEGGAADVSTTAHKGQMANINTALASDYGYSVDVSNRAEAIERLQEKATRYEKKAAKADKRAAVAGMAVAAAAGVLTGGAALALAGGTIGAMGGAIAAGIGGAAATGAVSATGGGRAAVAGGIQGTIESMALIGSLGAAGVGTGGAAGTAGSTGTITEAGGATTTVSFTSEAGTASSTFTELSPTITRSTGYLSSAKDALELYSLYRNSTGLLRGMPKQDYYDNRGYKA